MDVSLSENGKKEAKEVGKKLKKTQLLIDIVFTSLLRRTIQTSQIILEELQMMWIQEIKSWNLNERMYGGKKMNQ